MKAPIILSILPLSAVIFLLLAGSPFCDDAAARSAQPVAIFFGSGDFLQCHVPDELQWRVATLDADIQSGRVLLLDVVAAIKHAMPQSWLADHGMAPDHLSVAFAKSRQEILQVYAAALLAWGAADIVVPAAVEERAEVADESIAKCDPAAVWQVTYDASFHVLHFNMACNLAHDQALLSHLLQWLGDDGGWVSYESMYVPSLEEAYRRFVCNPGSQSREFIEISGNLGTFRYQFDFTAPTAAPQAQYDAPQNSPFCAIVGTQTNTRSMRAREIRRCTSGSQNAESESHDADARQRAEVLLNVMEILSEELEICTTSHSAERPAELSIDCLEELQSTLVSAMFGEMFGNSSIRGCELQQWAQLSAHLPQVLDLSSRCLLFREVSGTSPGHLQRMKKNRVNGVERGCILDWAASIAAAIRDRRNPLAIQVHCVASSDMISPSFLSSNTMFFFILPFILLNTSATVQQGWCRGSWFWRCSHQLILLRCCRGICPR